ncbi:MAG: hypothetical protein H6Q70_1164 [Firmicutes bacterium]|nr:hypothetical protein [Bacillota bacterium]
MMEKLPTYTEKELWQKFAMLTDEMKKFIEKNDIDQFLELNDQRDQFEKMIKNQTDMSFIQSEEGQVLLKRLIALQKEIYVAGQMWLNDSRMNRNVSRSYESLGLNISGMQVDGRL